MLRSVPTTFTQTVTAATATGAGAAFTLPWQDFDSVLVGLFVTTATGTTPTLDLYIQTLGPDGNWYDMYHWAQQTAATTAANQVFVGLSCTGQRTIGVVGSKTVAANTLGVGFMGQSVRLAYTIGGTSPSFTFSVNVYGTNSDRPL